MFSGSTCSLTYVQLVQGLIQYRSYLGCVGGGGRRPGSEHPRVQDLASTKPYQVEACSGTYCSSVGMGHVPGEV